MRRAALLAIVAISLAACSKDTTAPLPSDITGTYKLNNVSGFTLPMLLTSTDSSAIYVFAGTLVLDASMGFALTEADQEITLPHDTTNTIQTSTGTYTFSAGTINLHYTDRGVDVKGSYSASAVSLGAGGIKFIYNKQ